MGPELDLRFREVRDSEFRAGHAWFSMVPLKETMITPPPPTKKKKKTTILAIKVPQLSGEPSLSWSSTRCCRRG